MTYKIRLVSVVAAIGVISSGSRAVLAQSPQEVKPFESPLPTIRHDKAIMADATSVAPLDQISIVGENYFSGTLSFWLKFNSVNYNDGELPVVNWNLQSTSKNGLFEVSYVHAHKQLSFSIYEGDQQYDISAVYQEPMTWHFITVTWDLINKPTKRILYVDGVKAAEGEFTFVPEIKNISDFVVGGEGAIGKRNSANFNIDDLFIYDYAMTEAEIASLNKPK